MTIYVTTPDDQKRINDCFTNESEEELIERLYPDCIGYFITDMKSSEDPDYNGKFVQVMNADVSETRIFLTYEPMTQEEVEMLRIDCEELS